MCGFCIFSWIVSKQLRSYAKDPTTDDDFTELVSKYEEKISDYLRTKSPGSENLVDLKYEKHVVWFGRGFTATVEVGNWSKSGHDTCLTDMFEDLYEHVKGKFGNEGWYRSLYHSRRYEIV